jgi:hypothetical protein
MVLRALLAVTTLLGAVPFRVCTCGAAHVHHALPATPCEDAGGCCDPTAVSESTAEHDHDCLAVKPRAAMSVAVSASVADVPAASLHLFALPADLSLQGDFPRVAVEPRSPDPPPDRPLYLTLKILRN